MSNGVPPYQLSLNNLNNNQVPADSLCEGQYVYTIVDGLSCEYTDTFNITQPDLLQLVVNDLGGILSADVTGGVLPYYYFWYDSVSYIGNSQQQNISYGGEYTCVVEDQNQCVTQTSINILQQTSIWEDHIGDLLIYPNPVESILNIVSSKKIHRISFTDVLGNQLQPRIDYSNNIISIDCIDFANGVYFLILEYSKGRNHVSKVVLE